MQHPSAEPVSLEGIEASAEIVADDRRPRMAEPLPVLLLAVGDVRLSADAGLRKDLDTFYVTLLGFERSEASDNVAYRAENYSIVFEFASARLVREDMRSLGIEVRSLRQIEAKLIEAEIEYQWQKGLSPGQQSVLLRDPAGNWIELSGTSMVR